MPFAPEAALATSPPPVEVPVSLRDGEEGLGELTSVKADELAAKELQEQEAQQGASVLAQAATEPAAEVDPLLTDVRNILTMDLTSILKSEDTDASRKARFSDEGRADFVAEGERIAELFFAKRAALKHDEVLVLIRKWLQRIPQANAWFLFQEAKIKTDMVLGLFNEKPS